jgi:hypothetical protein
MERPLVFKEAPEVKEKHCLWISIINAWSEERKIDRQTANLDISCSYITVFPQPSFTFELRTQAHAQ